jgi:hypothetical protein
MGPTRVSSSAEVAHASASMTAVEPRGVTMRVDVDVENLAVPTFAELPEPLDTPVVRPSDCAAAPPLPPPPPPSDAPPPPPPPPACAREASLCARMRVSSLHPDSCQLRGFDSNVVPPRMMSKSRAASAAVWPVAAAKKGFDGARPRASASSCTSADGCWPKAVAISSIIGVATRGGSILRTRSHTPQTTYVAGVSARVATVHSPRRETPAFSCKRHAPLGSPWGTPQRTHEGAPRRPPGGPQPAPAPCRATERVIYLHKQVGLVRGEGCGVSGGR